MQVSYITYESLLEGYENEQQTSIYNTCILYLYLIMSPNKFMCYGYILNHNY